MDGDPQGRANLPAGARGERRTLLGRAPGIPLPSLADATSDVGGIVRRVNERFGTRFREFERTPENLARVRDLIDRGDLNTFGTAEGAERGGGLPASRREALKDRLRAAYGRPELGRLRRRAERL